MSEKASADLEKLKGELVDGVRAEVQKLAVGIGSAMSVLALLTIATSGERVKKVQVIEFSRKAAKRFRAAGDVVAAALLEQLADLVETF